MATKIGGVPHTVRQNIDGILVNGADNTEGFARACIKLLKNKPLAKKMGEMGCRRVKKLFLWENTIAKMQNLYERLIRHKK